MSSNSKHIIIKRAAYDHIRRRQQASVKLSQWFSNLISCIKITWKSLLVKQTAVQGVGWGAQSSDSVDLGKGLRIGISSKFPGDAHVHGLGITFSFILLKLFHLEIISNLKVARSVKITLFP